MGDCPVKQGVLSHHLSHHYSKFAWLPIGRHYVIAVGVSTHYYPELTQYCNTITTWPEKERENGFSSSFGANSNRGSGYCWSALPFITTAPHVGRVIRDPDQATGQRATYWSQEDHHLYLSCLLKSNFKPKLAYTKFSMLKRLSVHILSCLKLWWNTH